MLSAAQALAGTPLVGAGVACRQQRPSSRGLALKTNALFGRKDPEKEREKEEQFRLQQELLQRRKGGEWQKEVIERRAEVSRYLNDKEYKKKVDAEKRKRFDEMRKEEEAAMELPLWGPKGLNIIIPVNPMGNPLYDQGERFDLRGKYVDDGWVDEDADVMGKIARFFKGGDKKKQDKEEGSGKAGKGKKK